MANEVTVTSSLQIRKGSFTFRSLPTSFKANLNTASGPKPAGLTVSTLGTNVDFSGLITPGFCWIYNQDTTNYVSVGIYDGTTFFPLLEVGPQEGYVVKLSRNLGNEFLGTGTPSDVNYMRLMASVASCEVIVAAFEAD